MTSVGAFEAKTHLARLLERVARGERITITKHGVPVAVLVPPTGSRSTSTPEAIEALREFRKGRTLGEASLRGLIEEGRR